MILTLSMFRNQGSDGEKLSMGKTYPEFHSTVTSQSHNSFPSYIFKRLEDHPYLLWVYT